MKERIRVAVVGTGRIATKVHIPLYLSNADVDLVGLVDADARRVERTAKRFRVKQFFTSVDQLFERLDVDAVSVCTPPDTHSDIVVKALDSGAHVLCEKPLATNLDEGRRMVEASHARERLLMVGFHRRFEANYRRAKAWILGGKLGHAYCIEDHLLQRSPLTFGKSRWFYQAGAGGALLDLGSHVIDMLNYLFDDFPVAVMARATTYLDSPVEDCCILILAYPNGRTGIASVSWLAPISIENTAIHGTAQSLYLSPNFFLQLNATDLQDVALWRKITERLIGMKFPSLVHARHADPYHLEIDQFLGHVRKNTIDGSNAVDALNVLIACDAAKKALETHTTMEISSFKST